LALVSSAEKSGLRNRAEKKMVVTAGETRAQKKKKMDAIAGYHFTGHNEKKLMGSFIVQKY